jgi:Uri superfamily endonuclease
MERHFIDLEKSFMPRWHIRYFLSGIHFLIGAS